MTARNGGLWIAALTLLVAGTLSPHIANAQARCTKVRSLSAVLSDPGNYCLRGNLSSSASAGAAISITADDVALNLAGFTLDGSAAGPATAAVGIQGLERSNVTVRNGTVRGFENGVSLSGPGGGGHDVHRIRAEGNTRVGIRAGGVGSTVRNCQVLNTGGAASGFPSVGIQSSGVGTRILNNGISGMVPGTGDFLAVGIHMQSATGGQVEDNTITGAGDCIDNCAGIVIAASSDVFVVDNRISTMLFGVSYQDDGATGKYRDNLTSNVDNEFDTHAADDAGNND